LTRCLQSAVAQTKTIVYVDSGSTDESVVYAESLRIDVVHLDMSQPFGAGRARNAGFEHLVRTRRDLPYVQFIDGDCELIDGWLEFARQHLEKNSQWAIVAGRRRERFPERSVYNRLCDIEWNTPIGETKACGGDFMVRVSAFLEVDGFNPGVVAGEEPELCYRLRWKGWKIFRLDHDMTIHDAAITRLSQWWRRCVRSGHAYAQGFMLHGREQEHYCLRDSLRIWFWAFFLPAVALITSLTIIPEFFYLFLLYLVLFLKITVQIKSKIGRWGFAAIYAVFNILAKFAQLYGQFLFVIRLLLNKRILLIEYNKRN